MRLHRPGWLQRVCRPTNRQFCFRTLSESIDNRLEKRFTTDHVIYICWRLLRVLLFLLILVLFLQSGLNFFTWLIQTLNNYAGVEETFDSYIIESRENLQDDLQTYLDQKSHTLHLALIDPTAKQLINTYFDDNGCYRKGTNNSQSDLCVCTDLFFGSGCSLPTNFNFSYYQSQQNQLKKRKSIRVLNKHQPLTRLPNLIYSTVLYGCGQTFNCTQFVFNVTSQLEGLVEAFVFVEISPFTFTAKSTQNSSVLVASKIVSSTNFGTKSDPNESQRSSTWQSDPKKDFNVTKNVLNPLTNFTKIFYTHFPILSEHQNNQIHQISSAYAFLWNLLVHNITNYRPEDKVILMSPFSIPSLTLVEFLKFHIRHPEPVRFQENVLSNYSALEFTDRAYTVQYLSFLCLFEFNRLCHRQCLENSQLKSQFEILYWPIKEYLSLNNSLTGLFEKQQSYKLKLLAT